MKKVQQKLKLIKNGSIEGYTISNIKQVLSKQGYNNFEKWIYGQAVGIYKGEDLIYFHDFSRFLKSTVTPEFKRRVKEFIDGHADVLRELARR